MVAPYILWLKQQLSAKQKPNNKKVFMYSLILYMHSYVDIYVNIYLYIYIYMCVCINSRLRERPTRRR